MASTGAGLTNWPATPDSFTDGPYDPAIADAVNALQMNSGSFQTTQVTNCLATNFSEDLATSSVTATAGSVVLTTIPLRAGMVINKISFITAVTAASTPTNQWAGIATGFGATSPKCAAISADGLTAAMAADTLITFSLSSAYTVPTNALYYVFFCVAATAGPTVAAAVTLGAHGRGNVTPYKSGIGDTGKTTPYAIAATVAKPTSSLANPLVYLS